MRRTLHFGGGGHGQPMLCGAEWDKDVVTWRAYELASDAYKRWMYLADTEPCPNCHRILNDRGEFDVKVTDPKEARIAFLERKRLVTIEDCKVKLEAEDWHGIQDCGSDLRDIDNELDGLRY